MDKILEKLKKEPLKSAKFSRGWIFLEFDNQVIINHVVIERHQRCVGRWDMDLNVVYVDNDLKGIDMEAVAVHESVEKYVSQKYNLNPYKEAHDIATIKEKEFVKKNKGNWKSHQLKVAYIWRNENKEAGEEDEESDGSKVPY
jgi:hypothetical protein